MGLDGKHLMRILKVKSAQGLPLLGSKKLPLKKTVSPSDGVREAVKYDCRKSLDPVETQSWGECAAWLIVGEVL